QLSRERLLSPLRAPRRERTALRSGVARRHGPADRDLCGRGVSHRIDRGSLETPDHHGRGDGCRAAAALVLVAHQRVERSLVAARAPDVQASSDGLANLLDWVAGCVLVYGVLFGVGKLLLHETRPGMLLLALSALAGWVIYRDLSRRGWSAVVE